MGVGALRLKITPSVRRISSPAVTRGMREPVSSFAAP